MSPAQERTMRIFITGSSTGLGAMAARALLARNPAHQIYLHARSKERAADAWQAVPGAAGVLIGDLSTHAGIQEVASQCRALSDEPKAGGRLDCIIHNAGLYLGPYRATDDGLPSLFLVNVVAPYVLTCLADPPPRRLVFLTSGLARSGRPEDASRDFGWAKAGEAGWSDMAAYSTSKLWNIMFAKWFARRLQATGDGGTTANALNPGWVPTRMGGPHATDDIDAAVRTYIMLAEGSGASEGQTGKSWYQEREEKVPASADDEALQAGLIQKLEQLTGAKID